MRVISRKMWPMAEEEKFLQMAIFTRVNSWMGKLADMGEEWQMTISFMKDIGKTINTMVKEN